MANGFSIMLYWLTYYLLYISATLPAWAMIAGLLPGILLPGILSIVVGVLIF